MECSYCVFPPTLIYGFVPWISPKLLSRLSENVFGVLRFPAKSGKEENSIEKPIKPGRIGPPAPADVSVILTYEALVGRGIAGTVVDCA